MHESGTIEWINGRIISHIIEGEKGNAVLLGMERRSNVTEDKLSLTLKNDDTHEGEFPIYFT